jgi:hypothetical protein
MSEPDRGRERRGGLGCGLRFAFEDGRIVCRQTALKHSFFMTYEDFGHSDAPVDVHERFFGRHETFKHAPANKSLSPTHQVSSRGQIQSDSDKAAFTRPSRRLIPQNHPGRTSYSPSKTQQQPNSRCRMTKLQNVTQVHFTLHPKSNHLRFSAPPDTSHSAALFSCLLQSNNPA